MICTMAEKREMPKLSRLLDAFRRAGRPMSLSELKRKSGLGDINKETLDRLVERGTLVHMGARSGAKYALAKMLDGNIAKRADEPLRREIVEGFLRIEGSLAKLDRIESLSADVKNLQKGIDGIKMLLQNILTASIQETSAEEQTSDSGISLEDFETIVQALYGTSANRDGLDVSSLVNKLSSVGSLSVVKLYQFLDKMHEKGSIELLYEGKCIPSRFKLK